MPPLSPRLSGFTLLELLIVVVVMGVLSSMALLRFGEAQERTYQAAMQNDLRNFALARALYVAEDGVPARVEDVTEFHFSDRVYPVYYNSATSSLWSLVVGHRKSQTRCVASTETGEGAHRISCAREGELSFEATTSDQTVTVDATDAIQALAFGDSRAGRFQALAAQESEISQIIWEFGDGAVKAGGVAEMKQTSHTYLLPGRYLITLMLLKQDGTLAASHKWVEVGGTLTQTTQSLEEALGL